MPRGGELSSFKVPGVGNLLHSCKKNTNPGGIARGGVVTAGIDPCIKVARYSLNVGICGVPSYQVNGGAVRSLKYCCGFTLWMGGHGATILLQVVDLQCTSISTQ